MNKALIIIGSTSTGKTDFALDLAKKFNGELISCDSRQVYIGLDIGTGKLPGKKVKVKKGQGFWKMDGVKVWMYDVVDPKKQYTVYDYVKDAKKVINDIIARDKLPIIVGGTGLYLKALLEGLPSLVIPADSRLRKELEKLSLQELQIKLQKLSAQKWENMNNSDRQNPRRLIRALEIASSANINATAVGLMSTKSPNMSLVDQADVLKIGLTAPRQILYQRIDQRVIDRINQGMIDEAKSLHNKGLSFKRMKQLGLEYGVLADFLQGKIKEKDELVKIMQGKIHGYARRQVTWFKKERDIYWFDITNKLYSGQVESRVNSWYYCLNDKKD